MSPMVGSRARARECGGSVAAVSRALNRHPAVRPLYGSGFPCVALDLPIAGPRATYVTSDNYAGAAEAVRYLHGLGHREIATITGPTDLLPAAQRLAGYEDAIRELGLK